LRRPSIINDATTPIRFDEAALQTLAELPCRGRRIAVLGDMFELENSGAEHRQLAKTQRAAVDFSTSSATEPRWCTAALWRRYESERVISVRITRAGQALREQ